MILLALTETGSLSPSRSDAALYFVGHSFADVVIRDLRAFAESRLNQTTRARGISGVKGQRIQLDGLEAYELEANASDARTGRPVRIYQVLAPDRSGYFIIQGFVSPTRADDMIPEFKAVSATFRRTGGG